jgi:hypothetical protein
MDRIVLETHRRQLGQELVGQSGVDEEPEPDGGMVDDEQLVEFVTDAFGRHDLEPRRQRPHRLDQLGLGSELVAGDEPGSAQHAQRVVAEADLRSDRSAQGTRVARSTAPSNGSISSGVPSSPVNSSAIALTVKSRRDRSASISSANTTCGLRESSV